MSMPKYPPQSRDWNERAMTMPWDGIPFEFGTPLLTTVGNGIEADCTPLTTFQGLQPCFGQVPVDVNGLRINILMFGSNAVFASGYIVKLYVGREMESSGITGAPARYNFAVATGRPIERFPVFWIVPRGSRWRLRYINASGAAGIAAFFGAFGWYF